MDTKTKNLTLRISDRDKVSLQRAAQLQGSNLSEFILKAARQSAQEVLAQQSSFQLSSQQMQAFLDALDQPAKDIPNLRELFQTPPPWD
ncbi:DUF1778 domain-containing protein [bacterium]|nr:DUF1778 domain-containing protein [bacterium]